MKGRIAYIALLFLCTVNCSREAKPPGILSRQEMTNLMVDLYLAEAKLSTANISRDSASHLFRPFEDSLLKRRGISDSLLKQNYSYYLDHPKEMEMILDALIDTLSLREQRLSTSP
jgi:Domain of unknown function (DUF4296)